jgi:hypothetical protein
MFKNIQAQVEETQRRTALNSQDVAAAGAPTVSTDLVVYNTAMLDFAKSMRDIVQDMKSSKDVRSPTANL